MHKVRSSKSRKHAPASRRLLLQWHITERCNRRCTHCYQEGYSGEELEYDGLLNILDQFKTLFEQWMREGPPVPGRAHINVTGGEPFVRKDFLDLLETFAANKDWLSFGILCNGTFIDEDMARRLRELGTSFVQVSIEGKRERNDAIRGPGALDDTIAALKNLVREKIGTAISFTAQNDNYHEFVDVFRLGKELGVGRVWSDRLIPQGSGAELEEGVLPPEKVCEFFEIMRNAHSEAAGSFTRTEVYMHRALQFLVGGGRPYHCGAGDILVTIQSDGELLPCRRMPIGVGNVTETPLVELYYKSELFQALRDKDRISEGCEECQFNRSCGGGLRCLSYALTGDPFKADPGCWRAQRKACETNQRKMSEPKPQN